ncbi:MULTISPECIES: hypothetical protein [Pelosinus]|uniref:Uncharacterized protein n=1 Tax=Pelosinus fermentans B4 TaxID=1149862 RepID=I8RLQ1_9FIRM|nr:MULTISPECIES: hypothetical protein [Pelosinus]EIW19580.1 hypothetical protein FB4_2763 [Pelosinus fermentans B4]EIW24687.1 hypothetical protein FA11_3078 [Pelosinus fermentans A11]OAM96033.1 hypothetical protein FR7_04055 [Pelosinus fermentans DSM 17108]SDR35592.1 hypothetical protein SAMN04515679_4223 [Pelosinus fermentans]
MDGSKLKSQLIAQAKGGSISELLNWHKDYCEYNREERNLAAIFYHLLLINDNLAEFLSMIDYDKPTLVDEVGIYFEYSNLRDIWFNLNSNEIKRRIILSLLAPQNLKELEELSVLEFNTHFGAVPTPSTNYIQNPGNWSIKKYKNNITNNEEFLKATKFKWAFNVKPDIVIHTTKRTAICIECKYQSGEGSYPTDIEEIQEFRRRGLDQVQQTSLQKYMMEDLLGIDTQFIYLIQKYNAASNTHQSLYWKQVFAKLDLSGCPQFIRQCIARI